MKRQIAQFSLVVRDYDDAIRFDTEKLGFDLSRTKEWAPENAGS